MYSATDFTAHGYRVFRTPAFQAGEESSPTPLPLTALFASAISVFAAQGNLNRLYSIRQ